MPVTKSDLQHNMTKEPRSTTYWATILATHTEQYISPYRPADNVHA